jgi:hypothetical protein
MHPFEGERHACFWDGDLRGKYISTSILEYNQTPSSQVITRTVPFEEYSYPMKKIVDGVRPERPTDAITANVVGELWPLAEECWAQCRDRRPSARQVLERLNKIVIDC